MALAENVTLTIPVQVNKTAGTASSITFPLVGSGAPDGDSSPQSDAARGSVYIQDDATTDESPFWLKVDTNGADDDWVRAIVDKSEGAMSLEAALTMATDKKLYFRDTEIYIHSNADGQLTITADVSINIGDGTNQMAVQPDGEVQFEGTAKYIKTVPFPLAVGGGTADIVAFNGAPSINLNADNETFLFALRLDQSWDAASDITLYLDVGNEIAEDDGDDVSFTAQVRGYGDGETMSDAGQSIAALLDLTGGDEAINKINRVTGTIDWNHGTYNIAAGDTLVVEVTVNLTNGTEADGPLHVIAWGIQLTCNKLGTAT